MEKQTNNAHWIKDCPVDLEFIVKIEYGSNFAPEFLKACIPTFKCSNCGNVFFDTMYDRKYDKRYKDGIINYISEAEVTYKAWKEFISRRDLHMFNYCPYCGCNMTSEKEEDNKENDNKKDDDAHMSYETFCKKRAVQTEARRLLEEILNS